MRPTDLDVLRQAATLSHAVSSLGLPLHTAGRWRAVVSSHPMRVPTGVAQYTPCDFRRLICERARFGSANSTWFGEPRGEQIELRYLEFSDCRRDDHGVVWCRVDGGDEIHCCTTFRTPAELYDLLTHASHDGSADTDDVDIGNPVLLEFDRDHDLGVTLAHCRTGTDTPWGVDDAREAVTQLAVTATIEDVIATSLRNDTSQQLPPL